MYGHALGQAAGIGIAIAIANAGSRLGRWTQSQRGRVWVMVMLMVMLSATRFVGSVWEGAGGEGVSSQVQQREGRRRGG